METWIAGATAVLGTLLVLAGGALIVLRTLGRIPGPDDDQDEERTASGTVYGGQGSFGGPQPGGQGSFSGPEPSVARRVGSSLRRLSPASQLLGWGVLLLVLAALVAGLITLQLSVSAGAQ